MARSSQYKYMDEESIGPALLCIICRRPFKDPRCTPCNHIFCRECITERIGTNKGPCPACHKLISVDSFSQISYTLSNMLGTLRVKCTLCGQTELLRGNFDDHINKACPNARVPCPLAHNNCPWTGQRNELNNHLSTCIFHPSRSAITKLLAENRQLKEQCQQQLNDIQKLQAETQRQKFEIERANQRCHQYETQIKMFRDQMAGEKTDGIHS